MLLGWAGVPLPVCTPLAAARWRFLVAARLRVCDLPAQAAVEQQLRRALPRGTAILASTATTRTWESFFFAALPALPPPADLTPPGAHTHSTCPDATAGGVAGPRPRSHGCWHPLHPGVSAPQPRSAGNIAFGPTRRCANEGERPGIANGPGARPVRCLRCRRGACSAEALQRTGDHQRVLIPASGGWSPPDPWGPSPALPSTLCPASHAVRDPELPQHRVQQSPTPD